MFFSQKTSLNENLRYFTILQISKVFQDSPRYDRCKDNLIFVKKSKCFKVSIHRSLCPKMTQDNARYLKIPQNTIDSNISQDDLRSSTCLKEFLFIKMTQNIPRYTRSHKIPSRNCSSSSRNRRRLKITKILQKYTRLKQYTQKVF